jgi:hypothetical protein
MHTLQGGEHIEYNENELKAILMSDIFPGVLSIWVPRGEVRNRRCDKRGQGIGVCSGFALDRTPRYGAASCRHP